MSTLSPEDGTLTVTLSAREWSYVTTALAIAADDAVTHGYDVLAEEFLITWALVCQQVDR